MNIVPVSQTHSNSTSVSRSTHSRTRQMAAALLFGVTLTVLTAFAAPMFGDEIAEYVGGVSAAYADDCEGAGSC